VSLRTDPRWKTTLAEMQHTAHPCTASPEFRQFDYWLGEWDVEIGGQKLAKSSVKEGSDRVRQILESSPDGKTWAKNYDGLYIRRK